MKFPIVSSQLSACCETVQPQFGENNQMSCHTHVCHVDADVPGEAIGAGIFS